MCATRFSEGKDAIQCVELNKKNVLSVVNYFSAGGTAYEKGAIYTRTRRTIYVFTTAGEEQNKS